MSLQEIRLARGWSQEDLARQTGLSARTIQRIEGGKTASLESLKCLAAVFETSIAELMQETAIATPAVDDGGSKMDREKEALEYVQNLKGLYIHAIIFAVIMPCLAVLNYVISPEQNWVIYVVVPWLLAIGLQAVLTFSVFNFLGPQWEQRQFRRRMDNPGQGKDS